MVHWEQKQLPFLISRLSCRCWCRCSQLAPSTLQSQSLKDGWVPACPFWRTCVGKEAGKISRRSRVRSLGKARCLLLPGMRNAQLTVPSTALLWGPKVPPGDSAMM